MKDLLVDYWKTWTEQCVPDELKNLVSLAEKECREFQREKDRGQAFLGNLLFAFEEYGGKYYFVFDLIYHSEFIESNKIEELRPKIEQKERAHGFVSAYHKKLELMDI